MGTDYLFREIASPDRGEPMAFDAQYKVLPHWGTVAVSKAVPPLA